jgi:hypothetical protein
MKKKKNWEKYITMVDEFYELENIYRGMRLLFQGFGWTEQDLENPPSYPISLMNLHTKFQNAHSDLFKRLKTLFGDVDVNELNSYIQEKFHIIDLETPLKNGNNKRNNRRNEDY